MKEVMTQLDQACGIITLKVHDNFNRISDFLCNACLTNRIIKKKKRGKSLIFNDHVFKL
jgi:hypothetical protein